MSNIVDSEGAIMNLEHNPIATPYSTNRGAIEVLTGKDKVVDDISRQGLIQELVIKGNEKLAKLAMDANRSITVHQTELNAELVEETRAVTLQAQDKLSEDDEKLWAIYAKRRENIENDKKLPEHIKERRLRNLEEQYGNLSDIFAKRFNNIMIKSR